MAKADGVFIYIGTYPNEAAARADYDVAKDLHALGAIGTYDAAVIKKDEAGKVHVNKDEMATGMQDGGAPQRGQWSAFCFPRRSSAPPYWGGDWWDQRPPVAGYVPKRCQRVG